MCDCWQFEQKRDRDCCPHTAREPSHVIKMELKSYNVHVFLIQIICHSSGPYHVSSVTADLYEEREHCMREAYFVFLLRIGLQPRTLPEISVRQLPKRASAAKHSRKDLRNLRKLATTPGAVCKYYESE